VTHQAMGYLLKEQRFSKKKAAYFTLLELGHLGIELSEEDERKVYRGEY
jgi:hypothetical protein